MNIKSQNSRWDGHRSMGLLDIFYHVKIRPHIKKTHILGV